MMTIEEWLQYLIRVRDALPQDNPERARLDEKIAEVTDEISHCSCGKPR